MKTLAAAGIIVLFPCYSGAVLAGGLSTPGQGARALGMAGAFTAVADDGSAVYYNPAGLARIDGSVVEASLATLAPRLRYTMPGGATETSSKDALAPSLFIARRFTDRLVAAFGVYAPYARDAAIPADLANGFAAERAKILRTDLSAVLSWRATDALAIGGGLVVGYSQLEQSLPAGPVLRIDDKLDGTGVGAIVGLSWRVTDRLQAGLTYRSEMSVEHAGSRTQTAFGVATRSNARAKVQYPASLGLGIAFAPAENLTLALDFDWTGWSSMDQVTTRTDLWPDATTRLSARDSRDIRVGGEYRLPAGWSVRAGYAYSEAAFPATHVIPAQPDGDGHELALGVGRKLGNWSVDFAWQYAVTRERTATANIYGFNGKYNISQNLLALTTAWHF